MGYAPAKRAFPRIHVCHAPSCSPASLVRKMATPGTGKRSFKTDLPHAQGSGVSMEPVKRTNTGAHSVDGFDDIAVGVVIGFVLLMDDVAGDRASV